MTPWTYLLLAAACEMVWPIGAKYTHGFKQHYPVIAITFAIMILSFYLMTRAIDPSRKDHIAVGTAYAVWTAIGAAGTVTLGMLFLKEPHDLIRLACLTLIIAGVVGLKYLAPPDTNEPTLPSNPNAAVPAEKSSSHS